MGLFATRIPSLRISLRLYRTTPLFVSTSSATPTRASPPNSHFGAEYLVQSCGLSFDEALNASKLIPWVKSPEKPNNVLHFLREIGIAEPDIRTAVLRDSRILCSHLEKNWKPNIGKLRECGVSVEDISSILSRSPSIFKSNFVTKVDFLLGVLGSVEILTLVLKKNGTLLNYNLEKVIMPNLSFLREECSLSLLQIRLMIKTYPRVLSHNHESLKINAKIIQEMGILRSSGTFVHALNIVCSGINQTTIYEKMNSMKRCGLSQEEVALMVSKAPSLLRLSEDTLRRKMDFLIKEVGCDKSHVVRNPFLLLSNLENRMVPRNVVRKLLMSKEIPVAKLTFSTFVKPAEEEFVKKFILPYENDIPGLHQIYADASAKNIGGIELIKGTSS